MSRDAVSNKAVVPTATVQSDNTTPISRAGSASNAWEADSGTRVITKTASNSHVLDTASDLRLATFKERETERDAEGTNRKHRQFYVRDFGDKINPGWDDVRRQAGFRTDSALTQDSSKAITIEPRSAQITSLDVMHNWTQQIRDEESIATINILPKQSDASTGPEGHIVWIHIQDDFPSFDRLESVFKSHLARKLPGFVADTTISLLKRVKNTRERKLISGTAGRFLLPGITRYSARSSETGNQDHPCLFLSFPYLHLGRFSRVPPQRSMLQNDSGTNQENSYAPDGRKVISRLTPSDRLTPGSEADQNIRCGEKRSQRQGGQKNILGEQEHHTEETHHSPRTLLQSRYRLESTKKRDSNQAIFSLTNKQVRDCISRPSKPTPPETQIYLPPQDKPKAARKYTASSLMTWTWRGRTKVKRDRLYLPQLWSLSLSGDVMLTCGPINLDDLCGSALIRKDFEFGRSNLKHSVVRFILEHDGQRNDIFHYPAESCEWYFGLINKQRKVESHLGAHKSFSPDHIDRQSDTLRYAVIYHKGNAQSRQVVDCNNWLQIQSEHDAGPHLDLYLECDPLPKITINDMPLSIGVHDHNLRSPSHAKSASDSNVSTTPTTPRLLLTPEPLEPRGRSASSPSRSISPSRAWPAKYDAFFEWPFLEEVTRNVNTTVSHSSDERVQTWLAKTHVLLYRSYGCYMFDSLKPPAKVAACSQATKPVKLIKGTTLDSLKQKFFLRHNNVPAIITKVSELVSWEAERIFSNAKQLLGLFVPKDFVNPETSREKDAKMILLYWGLLDKILEGIVHGKLDESSLKLLSNALSQLLDIAKQTQSGVWQMAGNKDDPRNVSTNNSAIIHQPLVSGFENICGLLFNVIISMFENRSEPSSEKIGSVIANRSPSPAPSPVEGATRMAPNSLSVLTTVSATKTPVAFNKPTKGDTRSHKSFKEVIDEAVTHIRHDFDQAQRFLIQGADENRYQKSLGPVVTPEGITLLLLQRLARGVSRDGTINVIDMFERVVERLATRVEQAASRFLLLEINHVSEEIDIVHENFKEQKSFLEAYRDYLDPNVIKNSTVRRRTRFEYERDAIERLLNEVEERIKDCRELKEHIQRLANQNLQLVEGGQDAINSKLMLFTLVTIIFLPPSFVTSFFGMNLQGINGTDYQTKHFWIIAIPLTVGLLLLSLLVLYWNIVIGAYKRILAWTIFTDLDDD